MSEKTLHLAVGLDVPRSIAARTVFVAGTKGSGKTHNAGVMAEEMLAAGVHVLILDPLGAWWGLRSDAKGGPGGYPVIILGGEHADAPLLPTSGEVVAEYVVRSGQSAILDMSGFASNAEQDRFVAALLAKLFRLKAAEKSALHLIIDEADMFAPERPMSATEIPLLGATKTIVTKGRSRGLSMTLITQRPQSIAKAAIEEADVVLCHRMQGVNAVKAMRAWTDLYATREQAETFYASLPTLADGECWVWSPQFLKVFERHQFRRKTTFDSSRTPDPGETARRPKATAAVDLDKLTAEMRATAEAAKANDPAELRRQLAAERAEGAKLRAAKPATAPPAKNDAGRARRDAETIQRLRRGLEDAMKVIAEINAKGFEAVGIDPDVVRKAVETAAEQIVKAAAGKMQRQQAEFDRLKLQMSKTLAAMQKLLESDDVSVRVDVQHNEPFTVSSAPPPPRKVADAVPAGDGALTGPQQAILDTVLMLNTRGIAASRGSVARWLGIHPKGGSYGTNLGRLRGEGYLDGFALTERGTAAAKPTPTGIDAALVALPDEPKRAIVRALLDAASPLSREELAAALGLHPKGGSYGTNLGWLRTMGVITERGPIAVTEGLRR